MKTNQFILTITLLFILHSGTFAFRGPHPNDVAPSSFTSEELTKVSAPLLKKSCVHFRPPQMNVTDLLPNFYDFQGLRTISVAFRWCKRQEIDLRFRLLGFRGTRKKPRTRVLAAVVRTNYDNSVSFDFKPRCKPFLVYVEACAKRTKTARPICIMSQVRKVEPIIVPEPRLAFRPPYFLRLAPGDSARLKTRIVNSTDHSDGLGNGGFDVSKRRFLISTVLKSSNGSLISGTHLKERPNGRSLLSIKPEDSFGKKGKMLNRSKAFLKFALPSCPSNTASFAFRYGTNIQVSSKTKSLIKQDTKIPKIKQPVFPVIKSGDNVTLSVNATNVGGGLRAGGVSTELHYQWLIRTTDFTLWRSYARPIKGANKAFLRLKNLVCTNPGYSQFGTFGLKQYYVDVCNTFGCRRSKAIERRFRRDGSVITDWDC